MFKCDWCEKAYYTKPCLIQHQKVSKKCVEKQLNNGITPVNLKYYTCGNCDKKFTTKHNFERHSGRCKGVMEVNKTTVEEQIAALRQELSSLRQEFEEFKTMKNTVVQDDEKKSELSSQSNIIDEQRNKPQYTWDIIKLGLTGKIPHNIQDDYEDSEEDSEEENSDESEEENSDEDEE